MVACRALLSALGETRDLRALLRQNSRSHDHSIALAFPEGLMRMERIGLRPQEVGQRLDGSLTLSQWT